MLHIWLPTIAVLKQRLMYKECKCKEFCSQTSLGGEICSADLNTHKGHYDFKASSCAQRKAGRRKRALRFVTSHSRVTCFALASIRKTKRLRRKQTLEVEKKWHMVVFWRGYLKKESVYISAHWVPYLGTVQGSKRDYDLSLSSYPSLPFSSNVSCSRSPR